MAAPADARERALLAPFPGAVRADVLDGTWSPPVSDGSGRDRTILRRALALLADAGYELRGTELVERAQPASRSPSRSWSPPGPTASTRNGWRCSIASKLKRAGHQRARARGGCGAIRSAAHLASIST